MKDNAADELHPVRPHSQNTVRRLTDGSKGVRQDIVQCLAVRQALFELRRDSLELRVAHRLVLGRQRFDLRNDRFDLLDLPLRAGAK